MWKGQAMSDPRYVPCYTCNAKPGEDCRRIVTKPKGELLSYFHVQRLRTNEARERAEGLVEQA